MTEKRVKVSLIDLSIHATVKEAYPIGKGPLYYTFDRVFCAILNRQGLKSKDVEALRRYYDAVYTQREQYITNELKRILEENKNEPVVLVCGSSHVS